MRIQTQLFRAWVRKAARLGLGVLVMLGSIAGCGASGQEERVSRFGEYRGYSIERYDGYVQRSDYLVLSDGTRLAYELVLPTRRGIVADESLPVLFTYTPYLRAMTMVDEHRNILFDKLVALPWWKRAVVKVVALIKKPPLVEHLVDGTPWLERMLRHGYAALAVERPGTGASFGVMDPSFQAVSREIDEILNWIAEQPWSDGKIGMFGDSWCAQVQYAAASLGNPHLKAVFPVSGALDLYSSIAYPGGILNAAFARVFTTANTALDAMSTPVDGDSDGKLLAAARVEHEKHSVGKESDRALAQFPLRDSESDKGEVWWEETMALHPFAEKINLFRVPVYQSNGWHDIFTRDVFLWHANLTVPRRLHVRPLSHAEMDSSGPDLDLGAEIHRWFDFWLKGIENGIMDDAPVHYYVLGAPRGTEWRSSDQWPPADQETRRFYLGGGRTGTVDSPNDGLLSADRPEESDAKDRYTVDYSTSSSGLSRWTAMVFEPARYPDMRGNDEKALTFTTLPLQENIEVVGHPVVHLWIRTDAPDLDVFAVVEEVDPNGRSTYLTEGRLRASHRALAEAPYNNLGLPYHRSYREDIEALDEHVPAEIVFDLLPIANYFEKGHRVRVAIFHSDSGNFDTPRLEPAPTVEILRDSLRASYLELPFMQP